MTRPRNGLRPARTFWPMRTAAESRHMAIFLAQIEPFVKEREKQGNKALLRKYQRAKGNSKKKLYLILLLGNAPLVIRIAYGYDGFGVPISDLVQEGMDGLRKAIERYREDGGAALVTYATWWINQTIQRATIETTDMFPFRLPSHIAEKSLLVRNAANRLCEQLGRRPTIAEIKKRLERQGTAVAKKIKPEEIAQFMSPTFDEKKSLNELTPISGEPGTHERQKNIAAHQSYSNPETLLAARELRDQALVRLEHIRNIVRKMNKRECAILFGRLCLDGQEKPIVLQTFGELFGVTRERVRQIEVKALYRLKLHTKMGKSEIADLRTQIEELEAIICSINS